jgi:hypothetical protein
MSNNRQLRSSTAQGIRNVQRALGVITEGDSSSYDEVPELHESDAADNSSDSDASSDASAVDISGDNSADSDEREVVAQIEKEETELHVKFVASSDDEPQDGSDDYNPDSADPSSEEYDSEESDSSSDDEQQQ